MATALTAAVKLGPWALAGRVTLPSVQAGQGVATVPGPAGRSTILTRGNGSIPSALIHAGWVHIGDPDARAGMLIDAYQGHSGARSKMFLLATAAGRQIQLIHTLVAGELMNNSFAAISPDGHWLVSGEWNTIARLLVFPLPALSSLRPAPARPSLPDHLPPSLPLQLATTIVLRHPARNVQGCAFSTATTLLCSTNDPNTDLYPVPRQVLSVQLDRPLDGRTVAATPALLGPVPQQSACPGYGETEGIDVTAGKLSLSVVEPSPCRGSAQLYTFAAAAE